MPASPWEDAGESAEVQISWNRFPWVTLCLVGVMVVGAFVKEPIREVLSLGGGVGGRERWWQVLTCHGVHFGWGHFWRNIPAFALLGGLIEAKSRAILLAILGIAAGVVSLSVLQFEAGILPYRGSSGLVVAIFTWLGVNALLRRGAGWNTRLAGFMALALLAAKIWLELTEGRVLGVRPGATVSVAWSSHLGGALAGLLVAFFQESYCLLSARHALRKNKGSHP